jgi:nitrite reductase/ring-hydroxylating ferredoxin subunit
MRVGGGGSMRWTFRARDVSAVSPLDGRTVALAWCGARLGALENRCLHQGGLLGEGAIEKGWLRCPWHGYDYDPLAGRPSEGFSDGVPAYEVQERADGVYLRLPAVPDGCRTVSDVLAETLVAFGVSHAPAASPQGRLAGRLSQPSEPELARAAAMIRASRRPVLIVGHGARQAADQVRALAERLGAPVLTTFKAKGLVPDTHPLGAGVLGRSGAPVASWLMNEADLLIVVGASFSNHTGIAAYKTILEIDDDPAAIGRFDAVSAGVLGNAALTLAALLAGLGETRTEDQRPAVAERWAIWRAEKARRGADDRGRGVSAAAVFDMLSRHLPRMQSSLSMSETTPTRWAVTWSRRASPC